MVRLAWWKSLAENRCKMHIVGGTYAEKVLDPNWNELCGSGLRACCVLPPSIKINYHTYIGDDFSGLLDTKIKVFGIDSCEKKITSRTTSFQYLTSISAPLVVNTPPKGKQYEVIEVSSNEAILRFGMMEREAICHGDRVVYDPQSHSNPQLYHANGSTAAELAIIMNRTESLLMSGGNDPAKLFDNESVKVIVVKDGPRGALLYTKNKAAIPIPAFKTEHVFSIGSGDVFSAFFAFFWAEKKESPYEAAMNASKAVALYVSSKGALSKIEESSIKDFKNSPVDTSVNLASKKVYLAGPFFNLSERWFVEETLRHFVAMGISVFSPFHDVGLGGPEAVYHADIDELRKCDVVFANLCGLDCGTIYEVGYARACEKPVIVFVQNSNREYLTMLIGSDCHIFSDYTSAIYNTVWKVL